MLRYYYIIAHSYVNLFYQYSLVILFTFPWNYIQFESDNCYKLLFLVSISKLFFKMVDICLFLFYTNYSNYYCY